VFPKPDERASFLSDSGETQATGFVAARTQAFNPANCVLPRERGTALASTASKKRGGPYGGAGPPRFWGEQRDGGAEFQQARPEHSVRLLSEEAALFQTGGLGGLTIVPPKNGPQEARPESTTSLREVIPRSWD
jgi:hypothetical protein